MINVKHGDRVLTRNLSFFKLANDVNFPGRLDDQVNHEMIIESDHRDRGIERVGRG